jgi:hypothetical protein
VWNLSPWPGERRELADELDAAGVVRRELPESTRSWSLTSAAKQVIDADTWQAVADGYVSLYKSVIA